jgi:crossover junction endodeoxyribonuclease RuvC
VAIIILGIDPGSNVTGYGVIAMEGRRLEAVEQGTIRAPRGDWGPRLRAIFNGMAAVSKRCHPDVVAAERPFVHRNPATAIALGQARGAALAAALGNNESSLAEYTPRAVKLAVVGSGKADKTQVAHMVRHLLRITGPLAEDASDALAVAICHAHTGALSARLAERA